MSGSTIVVPHGCGIGDFINLRPLLQAVLRARPDQKVEVLGPPWLSPLVPDGVCVVPRAGGIPYWRRSSMQSIEPLLSRLASSRTLRVPAGVLSRPAIPQGLTWYLARVGYDEVINLLLDLMKLDLNTHWTSGCWSTETIHIVDYLAGTLEQRGISVDRENRTPTLERNGGAPGTVDVLLNVDAGSALKTMPMKHWISLALRLRSRGLRLGVLRGPRSRASLAMGHEVPGVQVMESPTLDAMLRHIQSTRAVVSPDTGVLHAAAALRTPYVGLYGPTDPLFLGPYSHWRGVVLTSPARHGTTCRTCWMAQMLPVAACGMGYPGGCMQRFSILDVESAVLQVLEPSPETLAGQDRWTYTSMSKQAGRSRAIRSYEESPSSAEQGAG